MSDFIIRYLVAGVLFAIIDGIWLSFVANKLYRSQLGSLLLDKPNLPAAVVFYLVFLVGLVVFVINPAISSGDWKVALGLGVLFGFVTYATYDLTNLATLKGYPLTITIVDLIWGTVLTASVSLVAFFILQRISS
ncbi:hypothetical protein A3F64_03005 [Candidatus Saccharibacteria bacterium RIFCSPHIGHO2_12_FULL_42_8]|nr:MAG: hypothetical protein A3F64_03005 [Candidatus Saccharibacteria bacterium RIFCSPHIGHO2_12_FULL_42_8]